MDNGTGSAYGVLANSVFGDTLPYVIQALSKYIPPEMLDELANNESPFVRQCVASNESATVEILDKLAEDTDMCIKFQVAINPNTSGETLTKLADNEDLSLKKIVAANTSCPELVRLWINNGGFAGLTLAEFIEKMSNE